MPPSAPLRLGGQRLLALMFENGRQTDATLTLAPHQTLDLVHT